MQGQNDDVVSYMNVGDAWSKEN